MDKNLETAKQINATRKIEEEMIYDFFKELTTIYKTMIKGIEEKVQAALTIKELNGELVVPGMPGSTNVWLINIIGSISDFAINFDRSSIKLNKEIHRTKEEINNAINDDKVSRLLSEIESSSTTTENVSTIIKTIADSNMNVVKKIDQLTAKLLKGKPSARQLKDLSTQYEEILKRRLTYKVQRDKIIGSVQASQRSYIESLDKFSESILFRDQALLNLLDGFCNCIECVVAGIEKTNGLLMKIHDSIDMGYDFGVFIETKRIVRYNITCPKFEEVDFDFDEEKIPLEIKNEDFPVAIAEVVENFVCGGENEISCTKGKYLLLMEEPDEEWCCVMNPITHVTGFVPSYCVKSTSKTLGICVREPKPGEAKGIVVGVGDFLSIIEDNPIDTMYKVETIRGEVGTIPKGSVGIICG
ncbi:SH3 domain containing protein [Histomonas meleagridis]|uniref:SH3 domain containing protein n=1 Tax=Histomonas meleagridis TaxID=135588 RepID=UPI003559CCED|nr:SH3 domain containing protein [Histomonas meleagridis]KAH0799689.1 SH3 domain containing protein [Histomonas meleagridis]